MVVSLDERSEVTGLKVQRSPSAILNNAALLPARNSTYRTQIRDCRAVRSEYLFTTTFGDSAVQQFTSANGPPAVTVSAIATVWAPPDYATVSLEVKGTAPTDAAAIAAAQDAFAACARS